MGEPVRFVAIEGAGPGEYRVVKLSDEAMRRTVYLWCPKCGQRAGLYDHLIHDDGRVTPSVVCDNCGWHEYVRLAGWSVQDG